MKTEAPGRIDIVIFPNGGKEVFGREPATPPVEESRYWPEVNDFVRRTAAKQLQEPEKYTGIYSVSENDILSMSWYPYIEEK